MKRFPICKRAWLAQLDGVSFPQGAWSPGADAASVAERPSGFFPVAGDSEAAKKAWLAQPDAPTWGKAAAAVASIASEAGVLAARKEACEQGVEEACDGLSREEEAKQAWLAKLDAPTWGAVAAAASALGKMGIGLAVGDDEQAKAAWVAKMDAPTWAAVAAAISEVAFSEAALEAVAVTSEIATEEEAKKAWLPRVHALTLGEVAAGLAELGEPDAAAALLASADSSQVKVDLVAALLAAAPGKSVASLLPAPMLGNISGRSPYKSPLRKRVSLEYKPRADTAPVAVAGAQYDPWLNDSPATVRLKDGMRKRNRE